MKKLMSMLFAAVIAGIVLSQGGCVAVTLSETARGEESYTFESVSPRFIRNYAANRYSLSLEAVLALNRNGEIVEKNKLSFGLFPSFELWPKNQIAARGMLTLIGPPFLLGIPYVNALLFEPFWSDFETDCDNPARAWSPVGFCKYCVSPKKYVQLTDFTVEKDGEILAADESGLIAIPEQYGMTIRFKIVRPPKARFGEDIPELKDYGGIEFTVTVE